jgi:hypothetical protein
MIRRKVIGPLLFGLAVVGLGACTRPIVGNAGGAALGSGGAVSVEGVSCHTPESLSTVPTQTVPAGFVAVSATRCVLGIEAVTGDGEWFVLREQEARGDLSALLAQLRTPDEKRPGDAMCPAIAYGQTVITLVDAAGRSIVPSIPQTACHAPMPSVLSAIRDLPWHTVRLTNVRQIRTQLEVSSNCSGSYKPVIDLAAAEGTRRAEVTAPVFPVAPSALQVCRYTLDSRDTVLVGKVSMKIGTLAAAATIQGAALVEALAVMNAAPPLTDATCTLPQAAFAVLYPVGGSGPYITVELGGCHRLLDDQGNLRQLDAAFTVPG